MRGTIDNALTASFREVFGWCPFNDGAPEGTLFCNAEPDGSKSNLRYRKSIPKPLPKPAQVAVKTLGETR